MASEGITREQAGRLFEALALDRVLEEREIQEAMNGPEPKLTPEEEAVLERMGSELPQRIGEWRAAADGCIVPRSEEKVGVLCVSDWHMGDIMESRCPQGCVRVREERRC